MQQFVAGFIIALLAAVPAVVLVFQKKASKARGVKNKYPKQLEELGKLTGQLAHEIKNPLSTIKVNLKLISEELEDWDVDRPALQKGKTVARSLRKITVIQKEADRLEEILNDFLRYLDRGELQLANVDVNDLVGAMIDFYSPQARSHSITMRQGLHSESLICKVDAGVLKQAILNLFINAQQAMSEGGELMIRTDRQKENAVIQISDTGSGIAPEKLSCIFEPYYSSRSQGSGLGLPTSKKIIESHGGVISVDSEPGKGTLFTIKLPIYSEQD